jgi:hypothetical protein
MKFVLFVGSILGLWVALLGHSIEAVVFGVLGVVVAVQAFKSRSGGPPADAPKRRD